MANTVEVKSRGFESDIDSNDPLMELSRIIGLVPPQPKAPDPQLSIEDSFAMDLENELKADEEIADIDFGDELLSAVDDDLSSAVDFGNDAPSIEPSLEDELSALLSDGLPAAEAQSVPLVEAYSEFEDADLADDMAADLAEVEAAFDTATEPVYPEAADEAEITFEADDWLDAPLPVSEAIAEPEAYQSTQEATDEDPVFSEMTRPVSPHVAVEQDEAELETEEPVLEFDPFELAAEDMEQTETIAASEPAFNLDEFVAVGDSLATMATSEPEPDFPETEFDSGNHVVAEAPVSAFKPEQEFERLLARTEPQPLVEPVAAAPEAVEAVEAFDIPDFEFDPEPVAEADPAFALDEELHDVAEVRSSWQPELTEKQAAPVSDEGDFDFDAILDDEIAATADDAGNGSTYAGAIAAAGAGYVASRVQAQPRETAPSHADPDLDIFREDVALAGDQNAAPQKRNWMAAAAVVGAIVLAGAGALWAFSGGNETTTDGNVALVKADPEPVKVAPENPGGKVVANQDKAVYDKVAGQQDTLPSGGQLVSESEEPLDIAAATPAETEAGKSEARIDQNGTVEAASGQAVDTLAIAPKKVKTFIVKPDGTLVERPIEAAPAVEQAAAPADAPGVPAAQTVAAEQPVAPAPVAAAPEPAAEAPKPVEAAAAPAEPVTAIVEPEAPAAAQPAEPAIKVVKTKKIKAPVEEVAAAPVEEPAPAPQASDAPVPERPAEQPVNVVGQTGGQQTGGQQAEEQQVASLEPAATTPAAGGYSIQIASTPSPEAAKATYAALTRKYGKVISGKGVSIQKADVEGKGTVYRVRIPAGSKAEANALCAKYKSAGGSCFVSK